MDSGCPGDEAEVDILAIEKDRGGKELDGYLRRLPYQTVCRPVEKRKSCPGLPPRPCASANIAESRHA